MILPQLARVVHYAFVTRNYADDQRSVMTLDAGGTNFVFSAIQGNRPMDSSFAFPAQGAELKRSLGTILDGFRRLREQLETPPVAISFAFPGPANYPLGIIVSPPNLPAYRNVALGPMLEDEFGLPTFINNDGDLFACGEAAAGFLPYVNHLLERAGTARRFRNLLGVTIGTGLGGGIVRDGELFVGDNAASGEIWLMRNKWERQRHAEDGASLRAVRRVFAERSGVRLESTPDPRTIADIADGRAPGDRAAALEAFRRLGEVAGDAIAQAIALLDGLVVIGGGLAASHRHFLPALVKEMNSCYTAVSGPSIHRLYAKAFNLEDRSQREEFLEGDFQELAVPGSSRKVRYDASPRLALGVSRLGTSEAIAVGAYSFALNQLDA